MGRLRGVQVAIQAGVSPEQVTAFVDLGILRPADDGWFSAGDVRRARVVEGLEWAGLPLEAMAKALERGELFLDFLDLSVHDRYSRLSEATFRDLSARHGIPLELLMVMRESIGFARPQPEDLVREDEWHTEIELPHLASGLDEAEMLEVAARLGDEITSAIEQALLAIYHAHQEHAWIDNFIGMSRASWIAPAFDRERQPPRDGVPAHLGIHPAHRGAWGRGRREPRGASCGLGPSGL